ncbi:fimbrial protein [Klebsiella aerogenes]|uniref:fimbrial protein n=1 Tax=Klebsiella aerogenes TaxID=548 RepID=UPI001CC5D3A4|nr:fimbrial protein [Klebsiella aerogenes]MCR1574218.1 type 1 fimbrial protein [Klebsiella aerogenes]UNX72892.1 type 1 fimbrial protein [Klebsiella aerogenes]
MKIIRMIATFALVYMGSGIAQVPAVSEGYEIDGANGVIYVRGALSESACRLDMSSVQQTVELGTVSTGQLRRDGHGTPIAVKLILHDCLRSPSVGQDRWLSTQLWNPYQPSVTATFNGMSSPEMPGLLAVNGAAGMALRLSDEQGRDVRIGSRGIPLQLTPGENQIIFYITPQRTSGELKADAFFAQVSFQLNYD